MNRDDPGIPRWLGSKTSACDSGGSSSIPGWGRSPGGGPGNPLQCSCLENAMDKGGWQAIVHRVVKSQTQLKRLITHTCTQDDLTFT